MTPSRALVNIAILLPSSFYYLFPLQQFGYQYPKTSMNCELCPETKSLDSAIPQFQITFINSDSAGKISNCCSPFALPFFQPRIFQSYRVISTTVAITFAPLFRICQAYNFYSWKDFSLSSLRLISQETAPRRLLTECSCPGNQLPLPLCSSHFCFSFASGLATRRGPLQIHKLKLCQTLCVFILFQLFMVPQTVKAQQTFLTTSTPPHRHTKCTCTLCVHTWRFQCQRKEVVLSVPLSC